MKPTIKSSIVAFVCLLTFGARVHAQLAPEIGYIHPAGAQAGTTVDVTLGGYDWTPDMQIFTHDPRVKLEILGPPTPVLISEPPYWFGAKARGYAWPLPREFRARLTVPAGMSHGYLHWQVANANGVSPTSVIQIGGIPEVLEDGGRTGPQVLPHLPVTVSGQIRRIEEIDRYQFRSEKTGPVTIELFARQLTSPANPMSLHGILQVYDDTGRRLVDSADTEGNDLAVTFVAEANRDYVVSLHDLDFAGDRSYVYRLSIKSGPGLLAAYPSAGKRGETRTVEFVGWGVATGAAKIESVSREVQFPSDPAINSFDTSLETPFGTSKPYSFLLSDDIEFVEGATLTELPGSITGGIDVRFGTDSYSTTMKKGDVWQISTKSLTMGKPLDLDLSLFGPDGVELANVDDVPGSTDPELTFTVPADGTYRINVSDRSGHSGNRGASYRLSVERPREAYSLTVPDRLSFTLGTSAKLPITVVRRGGFRGPINLIVEGLPEGIIASPNLLIPEGKNELGIDLTCAADAPATATLVKVTASATLSGVIVTQPPKLLVVAAIMKPRIKITPEGLDDVSKVRRGSTHLFPLLIERLEGFEGPITLEMTAKQQRHRQGLASDEFVVEPSAKRIEYPIFVPEWMETTKTSRMILNGSTRVPDPKGNVRTLLQRMELRVGILPEGALMKLAHKMGEYKAVVGGELSVPLVVSTAPEFHEAIRIELIPSESQMSLIAAEPVTLSEGESNTTLKIRLNDDPRILGEQQFQIRATAFQNGKWLVKSETTVLVDVRK